MAEIVGLISCLLCAFPFFVIGYYQKDSKEPIVFWAGDSTLKETVKNIQGYNREISKLYIKIFWVFAAALEIIGIPLLFAKQNSPVVILPILMTMLLVAGIIAAYLKVEKKHREQSM